MNKLYVPTTISVNRITLSNIIKILLGIAGYFGILMLISYLTGKSGSNADFFKAGKQSHVICWRLE